MSRSYKFIVWTDASTKETKDGILTKIGYVIKDRNFPPLLDSKIYRNINNSKGELKAGIESLEFLAQYCDCLKIETKKCEVEIKTDFTELERTINNNDIKSKNFEKVELLKKLKKLQKSFKKVECEEIDRKTNIAHNICCFMNGNNKKSLIENFYEIFKNPKLSIKKKLHSP